MDQQTLKAGLDRCERNAVVIGVLGLAACVAGAIADRAQFYQSYLFGYLFWAGITLGCLTLLVLHQVAGGTWGLIIRRLLETGAMLFPLMALLFVPIVFGMHDLYLWARPEDVAKNEILQHKSLYLNVPFFLIRTVLYFAVWITGASCLNRWSLEQDRTGDPSLIQRMRRFSGLWMVLMGMTLTLSAWDWVMSLEPLWYSTIFGLFTATGQVLSALSLLIIVMGLLSRTEAVSDQIQLRHYRDLGNMMLTFVMLWAYMALSQFLITWSGNLPEEIHGYLHRMHGGWEAVGLMVVLLLFFLPFMLLLSSEVKCNIKQLSGVAALVLVMKLVDQFWAVAPVFHPDHVHLHWMDLAAPIGIGGLWLAAFLHLLKHRALLPMKDPRLAAGRDPHEEEALAHARN